MALNTRQPTISAARRPHSVGFLHTLGHPVEAQDWLYNCDETMLNQVMAHKSLNRNLIVVTHSGCIGQLESLHGYPHSATSEYDSALFISLDSHGKPVIRGILNPEDWKRLAQQKNH
ncbi:Dihydroxyacid dehydratase/phosphogluconate dehydratase [Pseudomonas syringae pv. actinidiae]|uniref:Dihydroxyacid dehydratase/phosphogluconate dehydratase n=1 Tax=Pseudomonas syringae pv. actinidiae TaxID=103796 RepID=A0A2V0QBA6_PSESF|nr:Dihydroxyacid dehydratase/phosphogluconate dehydratase [Pseudomonas syringae pv. actinidiae]